MIVAISKNSKLTSAVTMGLVLSAAVYGVVACSAPALPDAGSGEAEVKSAKTTPGDGAKASTAPADGGKAASTTTMKTPAAVDAGAADPACVERCTTDLGEKCSADADFCEGMCQTLDATQIACLVAAPDCSKPEWLRCVPNLGGGEK